MFPENDLGAIWLNTNLSYFSSNIKSFLFQLLHDLLPTEERLGRTVGGTDITCRFKCPTNPVADIEHCFFLCIKTRDVGSWLLRLVQAHGAFTKSDILKLRLANNDAVIWVVGNTLRYIWSRRSTGKTADVRTYLAQLNTDALWMKETHNLELGNQIMEILRQN